MGTADPKIAEAAQRAPDRGVARRQAFLKAARDVFLEQGYEATSVNDVVRRAGGSLATLYAQFGNKEGLFLAVVQDQYEWFTRAMTPGSIDHLPLEEGLQVIGEHFLNAMLDPGNLAFFRLMVSEAKKLPDDPQRLMLSRGERIRAIVAKFLADHDPSIRDPDTAASYLIGLLRSQHHYVALVNENYLFGPAERKAHVAAVVAFFLKGLR